MLCLKRCDILLFYFYKNIETQIVCFCFFICSQGTILEETEDQLNFILPGCLLPYQKEIKNLFFCEKQKFLRNKRFSAVFAKTSFNPVFTNRNSLKKLISKTKVFNNKTADTDMSENKTNISTTRAR